MITETGTYLLNNYMEKNAGFSVIRFMNGLKDAWRAANTTVEAAGKGVAGAAGKAGGTAATKATSEAAGEAAANAAKTTEEAAKKGGGFWSHGASVLGGATLTGIPVVVGGMNTAQQMTTPQFSGVPTA